MYGMNIRRHPLERQQILATDWGRPDCIRPKAKDCIRMILSRIRRADEADIESIMHLIGSYTILDQLGGLLGQKHYKSGYERPSKLICVIQPPLRGDCLVSMVTEEVVKAAARNFGNGKEVTLLLD
jgi:hypothetical protein